MWGPSALSHYKNKFKKLIDPEDPTVDRSLYTAIQGHDVSILDTLPAQVLVLAV